MRVSVYRALIKNATICLNDKSQLCLVLTFAERSAGIPNCTFVLENQLDIQRIKTLFSYDPWVKLKGQSVQMLKGQRVELVVSDGVLCGFMHPLYHKYMPILTDEFQELSGEEFHEQFEFT